MVPFEYDEVELGYVGDELTSVTYKKATSTVATLSITWFGGKVTKVVRV
jgi:hypothetical protein